MKKAFLERHTFTLMKSHFFYLHKKSQRMKILLLFISIIISGNLFSQQMLLPNEETIFSFKLKNGKTMILAEDKKNGYLIYRLGKKKNIEFESFLIQQKQTVS